MLFSILLLLRDSFFTLHVEYYLFVLQLKAIDISETFTLDEHFQVQRLLIKY